MRQSGCDAFVRGCARAALAAWLSVLGAWSALAAGTPVNREILGLYDGASEPLPEQTRLHRMLEMPLNHLGYKLTLHDIARGLPDPTEARRYRAVATWFSGRVSGAEAYLPWAAKVARAGVRFIVVESVGALGGKGELAPINAFLGELGLAYAAYFVGEGGETRIKTLDPGMIGFEQKPGSEPLAHQVIVVKSPRWSVHLSVTDPAHRWVKAPASALVVTGPKGGLIASGFAVRYDAATGRVRWLVDPFAFLAAALGAGRMPIPDTTTVSGRRLYFSHIDGDGWSNPSEVEPYARRRAPAAEVVLDRLIRPYPDLPVSMGLIAGDVDPAYGGVAATAGIARAMFALPQVEVASHTHTHPYHWRFYERYQRDREISDVAAFLGKRPGYDELSLGALVRQWRASIGMAAAEAASAPTAEPSLPRARPHLPFDLEQEVGGALEAATQYAPAGKTARLYLWSGDTRPFEAAIRATRLAGVRNLNGGDSRLDSAYPSIAYVPPLARTIGAERQIYAVNSNENTYTNGWTGPFDAFKMLSETLDNTELPRRLKGFNLYYHSYSAAKPEALAAVVSHLERARTTPVAPITASHYAAIAEGFFSTEITALGHGRWRIGRRGALNTIRLERSDDLEIDYALSSGVIGHSHHAGALYATLDPAVPDAVVAVTPAGPSRRNGSLARAYLAESRWVLSAVSRASCALAATAQGYGAGEMRWAGLPVGTYVVTAARDGGVLASEPIATDAQGRLAFRIDTSAIEPLQLRIACSTGTAQPEPAAPAGRRPARVRRSAGPA